MYQVDRKSTRLNSSHLVISYAVFCLKKNKQFTTAILPTSASATLPLPPRRLRAARGLVCHRQSWSGPVRWAWWHTVLFFFFNDTATTEIYTLSLHDALPI